MCDLTFYGEEQLRGALQACWDEYHELMPDALYERVKAVLGIREFTATPLQHNDGSLEGRQVERSPRRSGSAPPGAHSDGHD